VTCGAGGERREHAGTIAGQHWQHAVIDPLALRVAAAADLTAVGLRASGRSVPWRPASGFIDAVMGTAPLRGYEP